MNNNELGDPTDVTQSFSLNNNRYFDFSFVIVFCVNMKFVASL